MRGLSPPWAQDTSERKNTQGRLVATAQRHCRPRRLWELLYPPHPSPRKAHSGQEASSCARSSFTDQGGQPRIPGSGAGRRGAAGPEEGTAGWSHTATRALGCGTEGLAPRSPASLGQSFPYLQRRGKKKAAGVVNSPLVPRPSHIVFVPIPRAHLSFQKWPATLGSRGHAREGAGSDTDLGTDPQPPTCSLPPAPSTQSSLQQEQ